MPVIQVSQKRTQQEKLKHFLKFIFISLIVIGIVVIGYHQYKKSKLLNKQTNNLDQSLQTDISNKLILNLDKSINTNLEKRLIEKGIEITRNTQTANNALSRNYKLKNAEPIQTNVFLIATRFDNTIDNLSTTDAQTILQTGKYKGFKIYVLPDAYQYILTIPKHANTFEVITQKELSDNIFNNKKSLFILSMSELNPKLKAIAIDEDNPLSKDFKINKYPLVDIFWLKSTSSELTSKVKNVLGNSNYNQDLIHDIIVTGTSTVGARTHYIVYQRNHDPIFPIRPMIKILREADIAHISNESVFVKGCTQTPQTLSFCGPMESFQMLTNAGIDVVGLTGNHILDYGLQNFYNTLNLYKQHNIKYFGGGKNYKDAHTPAILKIGNTKVAFLGYNFIPPYTYYATAYKGGSAQYSPEILKHDISEAKKKADFVFIDMQWGNEYQHTHLPIQEYYGHLAIDDGATIVTGVHPHYTQGIEYYKNGIIFYSIGNFLFDQLHQNETREGVIVRHIFYGDKYLGYQLIPTRIANNLQVNVAPDNRKNVILNTIYQFSKIDKNEK